MSEPTTSPGSPERAELLLRHQERIRRVCFEVVPWPERAHELEMDLWCELLARELPEDWADERYLKAVIRLAPWSKVKGCSFCAVVRYRERYFGDLRAKYARGYRDPEPSFD